MSDELARILAGSPVQSLEGGVRRINPPTTFWGHPKTSTNDSMYYLPESLIGELPYRYQGIASHGLLAALMFGAGQPVAAWPNAGYALGSYLSGQANPVARPESQMPMPVYPIRNKLAGPE